MSSIDGKEIDQITLSYLMQELQQIEHDFEIGGHTGENEKKFMSRLKEINEKISSRNFSDKDKADALEAQRYATEIIPIMQYLEEAHQRLQRDFEIGRYTGENEKAMMQKMKRIRQKMAQVAGKGDDWPEEAVWVKCPKQVVISDDWDYGPIMGVCPECEGSGYKLQLRQKIE